MQSTDLTEVRVRGKRSRKRSSTPASGSSSHSGSSSSLLTQSRKRLRRHIEEESKDHVPVSGSSPLERLPTELLENIFLKCLNISLPRASLSIGKRLASDYVKTEFFCIAFSGTSDLRYTGYLDCLPVHLEEADHLFECFDTEHRIAQFQSNLLALRWMTPWALMHSIKQLCISKVVKILQQQNLDSLVYNRNNNSPERSKSLTETITELYESVESDDRRWSSITSQEWRWSNATRQQKVDLVLRTHQGFPHITSVNSRITSRSSNMPIFSESVVDYSQIFRCVRGCRIPQKVLHGPWDVPKCTMLAQLSKACCDFDRTGATTDEEVADNGLRAAIMQPSIQAIVTLVGSLRRFRAGCTLPECNVCEWGGDRCVGTVFMFHNGIMVNSGHLKLALGEDSSIQVLECLLDAMNIEVDWSDNAILAWIVKKREVEDARGQFLLERYVDLLQARRNPSMTYERQKELMSRDWINSKPSWLDDEDDLRDEDDLHDEDDWNF